MTNSSEVPFSGKAVYHLHSCQVRAWLFVRGLLVVSRHNPYIRSGDQRHSRIQDAKRALPLSDYGVVDYSSGHQTELLLHEVTRSETPDPAKIRQLNYYLHAAHELYGIQAKGILHMADKKKLDIEYDRQAALEDIERLAVLAAGSMPAVVRKPICTGCTNRDWCFV